MIFARSNSFEPFESQDIHEPVVVEHLSSESRLRDGKTCCLAWAPDNSYFAWSYGTHHLHLIPWDSERQRRVPEETCESLSSRKYHRIDCFETISSLAFGMLWGKQSKCYLQGRLLAPLVIATGHCTGKIKLWDCKTGLKITELLDHKCVVRSLDFTRNEHFQLVSASEDCTLKLWDLNNDGNMYHTLKVANTKLFGCQFSPNMRWIIGVGQMKSVLKWNFSAIKEPPEHLIGHQNDVVTCQFSPDSALLATGSLDTKVILWNVDTLEQLKVLGHLHPSPSWIFAGGCNEHHVRALSISQYTLTLGTVCDDGLVRFWNLSCEGNPLSVASIEDVVSCQFSNGGGVLAVGCRNGDVRFLESPVRVAPLKSLCRTAIRRVTDCEGANQLPLPCQLVQFVQYRDIVNVKQK